MYLLNEHDILLIFNPEFCFPLEIQPFNVVLILKYKVSICVDGRR